MRIYSLFNKLSLTLLAARHPLGGWTELHFVRPASLGVHAVARECPGMLDYVCPGQGTDSRGSRRDPTPGIITVIHRPRQGYPQTYSVAKPPHRKDTLPSDYPNTAGLPEQ